MSLITASLLDRLWKSGIKPLIDNVDTNNKQIKVLESQMKGFIALQDGSTTGDAELQDIRIGEGGEVYSTAGEAVRKQYKQLSSKIDTFDFDKTILTIDGYINTNGDVDIVNTWGHSDYILCFSGENVVISETVHKNRGCCVSFYDSDKKFIFGSEPYELPVGQTYSFNITAPDHTRYVRFSSQTNENFFGKIDYVSSMQFKMKHILNDDFDIVNFKHRGDYGYYSDGSNNLNDYKKTGYYLIGKENILNAPSNMFESYQNILFVFELRGYIYQYFICKNTKTFFRVFNGTAWSEWFYSDADERILNIQNDIKNVRKEFDDCGFINFSKFAIVGDSLSVGYNTDSLGVPHQTDYFHSWGYYIQRKFGTKCYWTGKSGQTCKTWLENTDNDWGLKYTQNLGEMPLYIISMGANESGITIGTISDINSNAATLYGYVGKIIQELRKISPNSFIVCTGISRGQGQTANNPVNTVYKTVCQNMSKCYYLDVASELNSEPFTNFYYNYHYSALGYNKMGELFNRKLAECIAKNYSDFIYINETDKVTLM